VEARAAERSAPRSLLSALRRPGKGSADAAPLRVLGELKRRSPSAGSIHEDLRPGPTARILAEAGCAGLSVLTEAEFFGGSPEALQEVRAAVDLPLLRKDFIVDPYQVVEARALGADAVLLLAAVLGDDEILPLVEVARGWGLEVLAEAHGPEEVRRLVDLGMPLIGCNARDLKTFQVDLPRALEWCAGVPGDRVVVAESGLREAEDARRVADAPVDAALVGEGLMRGGRPAERFAELFGRPTA